MENGHLLRFRDIHDADWKNTGHLTPIEGMGEVPFAIQRVYYITGVSGEASRGYHAHKTLEQILICLHGSVRVRLQTAQFEKEYLLDDPFTGLYVGQMAWHEMYDFQNEAVLLVLASEHYDEADYIRDIQAFLKLLEEAGE